MKIKVKKVYYCDFCIKHSLRPLKEHEKHCTGNINRVCRLCPNNIDLKLIVDRFRDEISFSEKEDGGITIYTDIKIPTKKDILDSVENCPICALTIMKALKKEFEFFWIHDFDYKEELRKWWDIINNENQERIWEAEREDLCR